ncbi:YbhB/YbcL family Raf kinase inhibitor-like protein [Vulgatibacter sp.]|uniref:YbhB/YbcL family Raf kinase inhibitor-like protein n=1 Tax=Vulgatibacter sp. TaxID=1971226 RepID=UPI003569C40F
MDEQMDVTNTVTPDRILELEDRPDWALDLLDFELHSNAFRDGQRIPPRYTADGDDLSPALAWGRPPEGTKSLALVVDDPDAPGGLFTHWMVLGLPAAPGDLVEGRGTDPSDVAGAQTLTNDFDRVGWASPAPPRGHPQHRYRFRLLALDNEPRLPSSSRRGDFDQAIEGHVIGETILTGHYGR